MPFTRKGVNGTGRILINGCFTLGETLILILELYHMYVPASIGGIER